MEKREILNRIYGYLQWDKRIDASRITVRNEGTRIIIEGEVDSNMQKRIAGELVYNVDGVNMVINNLEINKKSEAALEHADQELEQTLENMIDWDERIHSDDIDISLKAGTVVIRGTVSSGTEKSVIEEVVSTADGVTTIIDQLQVNGETTRTNDEIKDEIERQYEKTPIFDGQRLEVMVDNGVVSLEGVLSTDMARTEAVNIAMNTLGVRDVIESITVG